MTTLITGILANTYGRKIALIFCLSIGSYFVFILPFSSNYWLTLILYAGMGSNIPFLNFSSLYLNEIGDTEFISTSN